MILRYPYRCYPDPGQKARLAKAFGCARVVWNDALDLNRKLYQDKGKPFDSGALMKRCITSDVLLRQNAPRNGAGLQVLPIACSNNPSET